ncbi:hypothetical protein IT412_05735 [Candidatus Peregrinibacteria bacterium]|nr:hypothetical protein [Candidatus Peregrinibacteria bacterium]
MQNKSSTSLAIISILAIFGVLVIAINGSEEGAIRKPFANKINETVENLSKESPKKNEPEAKIEYDGKTVKVEKKEIAEVEVETPVQNIDSFDQKQINYANLKAAGLNNFVVKPKPFKGTFFDQFDLSVLNGLDVVEKSVVLNLNGQEKEMITAYEFNFKDKESVGEIYSFLKSSIKGELGTTINETNKYGLASFYINFSEPVENAFLVVKMPENVYALSYPRVVTDGINFQEIISKLLEGLI